MQEPDVFNLIYHLAPFERRGQVWRVNVAQLLKRRHVFNGKRVIGVVQGAGLETLASVQACFPDGWADFMVRPNNPELGEAATFPELLEAVASPDPHQATFYAHTKGVTATRPPECSARWRDAMYRLCLDNMPLVRLALRSYVACGGYKMRYPGHRPMRSWLYWHFAGSFYWFRNDAVFAGERWRQLPVCRSMTESFLGNLFPPLKSWCIAYGGWQGNESNPASFGAFLDY